MTDHLCVICARREPSERHTVCAPCLGRLDDDLARLVELTALAQRWMYHPRTNASPGARAVPTSKPPLDLSALDAALANDALPLLESWERLTREHFGLGPYGPASLARKGATVKGCADFLRSWLLRIAEQPKYPIEELAREIREQRAQLTRLDPDAEVDARAKLRCPGDHPEADGRLCHAVILYDAEHPSEDITCHRCGTTWTGLRLRLVAYYDDSQTVWAYATEVFDLVDVKPATLRQWVKRGHVRRKGSMYDIGAVYRRHADAGMGVAEP